MPLPPKARLRVVQCRVAPLWKRALAYCLDEFLLFMLLQLLVLAWGANTFAASTFIALSTTYMVLCVYRFGGTAGKLLLGLRITSINAMPVTLLQSFLRYSPYCLSGVLSLMVEADTLNVQNGDIPADIRIVTTLTIIWLVASLFALFSSKERRTLHDHLAYTMVVEIQHPEKE